MESPFDEEFLEKLPLAYRFLKRFETEHIGELYQKVKFSKSIPHRSIMMNNYKDFKPLSNICLVSPIDNMNNDKGDEE